MHTDDLNVKKDDILQMVKQADRSLTDAISASQQGVNWEGQELGEIGGALHNIEQKQEKLQKILNGEPV